MSNTHYCECGAIWRYNWPFGRKSKARKTFERQHTRKCKANRGTPR